MSIKFYFTDGMKLALIWDAEAYSCIVTVPHFCKYYATVEQKYNMNDNKIKT